MFSKKEGVIMKRWSFILAVILIISFCFTGCQNQQMLSVEEYNAKYAKTIDFEKGIDNKTFGNAVYQDRNLRRNADRCEKRRYRCVNRGNQDGRNEQGVCADRISGSARSDSDECACESC